MAARRTSASIRWSQSPTLTTAGSGVMGLDNLMDFAERMSPLGNATAAECADYIITLFSDLTRKVTMQNLYHDGGYSSMGNEHAGHARLQRGPGVSRREERPFQTHQEIAAAAICHTQRGGTFRKVPPR